MTGSETGSKSLEMPGIDPGTSRMLSERSTIWATPPWILDTKLENLNSDFNLLKLFKIEYFWVQLGHILRQHICNQMLLHFFSFLFEILYCIATVTNKNVKKIS